MLSRIRKKESAPRHIYTTVNCRTPKTKNNLKSSQRNGRLLTTEPCKSGG